MAGLIESERLAEITREEVRKYAANGRGLNIRLFFLGDDLTKMYSVIDVEYPVRKDVAGVVVMARIVRNQVIIEEDTTNKPLVDALMQQGIPREQIVLAYQGEPVPDPIEMF